MNNLELLIFSCGAKRYATTIVVVRFLIFFSDTSKKALTAQTNMVSYVV